MKKIDDFIDFFLHEKGETVQINGVSRVALFTGTSSGTAYYTDDLVIRTKQALSTGDTVTHQEKSWLIISQVTKEKNSYQGRLRQCNHVTKFILDDWLYAFPSILAVSTFGIRQGEVIQLVDGMLSCLLTDNVVTELIHVNQRFIASKSAWMITGIDRTHTGVLILYADRDAFVEGDDQENEIANASTLPDWHVEMGAETFTVELGGTYQLIANLYKGATIEEATILWHSSDETVATVSADGVVTGVSLGTVIITAAWAEHTDISASSDGEVEEQAPEVITYKFYSMDENGSNKSYTNFDVEQYSTRVMGIEKYLNGVLTTNDTYAFTLTPNGAYSGNYTYTVVNSVSISIQCWAYDSHIMTLAGVSNQNSERLEVSVRLNGY